MSQALIREPLTWQSALFAIEDVPLYYKSVAEILRRDFSVDHFAVYLYDRRQELFLAHRHGQEPEGDDCLTLSLEIGGEDLGQLRLSAATGLELEELEPFRSCLAQSLYVQTMITEQGRIIDDSLAQIQAIKAMGELLGDLDTELVLNRALKFFVDLIGADVGAALLYEESRSLLEVSHGLPSEVLASLCRESRSAREARETEPEYLELADETLSRFSLGTVLRIPLGLKAPHYSELFVVSGERLQLEGSQHELIASCQVIGSIAIQKTLEHEEKIRQQRLGEQLRMARDIQQKLLPSELPSLPRLSVAGRSLPALFVGGDYYDVLLGESGRLTAIIADVSGKGVQAAMRMSGLRAMLHGMSGLDHGPGEILTRINKLLLRDSVAGHFVTACCVSFSPDGSQFQLAVAGHEPLLMISREGARFIEGEPGLPLGLKVDQVYAETTYKLAAGDRLLFYTDGIADTADDQGTRFGSERMVECFKHDDGSPEANLKSLFDLLQEFRGQTDWSDDLTALTFQHS